MKVRILKNSWGPYVWYGDHIGEVVRILTPAEATVRNIFTHSQEESDCYAVEKPDISHKWGFVYKCDCEIVEEKKEETLMTEIDQHYNFFYYLTPEDLDKQYIKIDPYFVASQWNFNKNDPSGAIFHIFKTCARYGMKNTKAREIEAMYKTIKRLAELEGVNLE